jgi:hypothetical protein
MIKISFSYPLLTSIFLLINNSVFAQQIKLNGEVKSALETVDTAQIKADITYLADDKLKGRLPGTEGYQMAVDYVTERLKSLGVQPSGENGGWLQKVRLRKATTSNASLTVSGLQHTPEIAWGADYLIYPNPKTPEQHANAQVVFAGFGISEPALGYDDYAGLDVKGKIVMITRGSPDNFSSSVSAHTMNSTHLLKVAAEHGAIGVLMASSDSSARTGVKSRPFYSVMDGKGDVSVSGIYYSSQISFYGAVNYKLFSSFVQASGKSVADIIAKLKSGVPQSFPVNATVAVNYTSSYQDILSYNVVGKITGTDPQLKDTYVVHSAHLDHLGIGTPVKGDSIYNGAHDNASGVASVLAIAGIYQHIKIKPKRSLVFVLMTGEEMGDLGSGYFAKYPTVSGSLVADVNTDMPTIIAPLLSITALGAEHSSMAKQVDEAASLLNLSVEADPEPKQARFTRSDQYSFVVEGIPAIHVKYGSKTPDGKNNLNEMVAVWRAKYYHKPQDDINGIFNFGAGKTYAQLNFLIGYLIAGDKDKPTWNKGDIFAVR